MTRTHALCAAVLVSALATTGCTLFQEAQGTIPTPPPAAPTATSEPSSATPSGTPTAPAATPTAAPTDVVTKTVYKYYQVLDKLGQKPPKAPYKQLLTVTRGEAFEMWQNAVVSQANAGLRQTGSVKVVSTNRGKQTKKNGQTRMQLETCIDVSGVDVVDRKGKSVVVKGRPDRATERLLIVREENIWYVTQVRDGTKKC